MPPSTSVVLQGFTLYMYAAGLCSQPMLLPVHIIQYTRPCTMHSPRAITRSVEPLLARLDGEVDRLVLLPRDLGLEVDVHELPSAK